MIRVGCDIVDLKRFKKILRRTPAVRRRIFLPREMKGVSTEELAGIFAAKEAVVKALGFKAGAWQKITILKAKSGKPEVKLLHVKKKFKSCDLSVSHDGDYAMAVAVFLMKF